jgi:hypothetical protein
MTLQFVKLPYIPEFCKQKEEVPLLLSPMVNQNIVAHLIELLNHLHKKNTPENHL